MPNWQFFFANISRKLVMPSEILYGVSLIFCVQLLSSKKNLNFGYSEMENRRRLITSYREWKKNSFVFFYWVQFKKRLCLPNRVQKRVFEWKKKIFFMDRDKASCLIIKRTTKVYFKSNRTEFVCTSIWANAARAFPNSVNIQLHSNRYIEIEIHIYKYSHGIVYIGSV